MDLFRYFVRFLYKIRWYLVTLPLIALVVAWFLTRNMERIYDANTTIYTGMITGYNIEGTGAVGGNAQTNIANLMLIITTDNTIHEVSLRLFARCMMYGNPKKNNNYISAEHFRELNAMTPPEVKALINRSSELATYANLKAYEKPSQDNFLFGLLNYHPYFGINNITSRLKVLQLPSSDIIDISYSANDAGVVYNTLDILNDVFARQYQQIRFGETGNVINFFKREVNRLWRILTSAEDDLIRYNISKRIINYGEQTKQLAALEAQQQNFRNDQLMNYTTSKALLDYLERQLGNRAQVIRSNREFTDQIRDISRIQSRISNLKLMSSEGGGNNNESQEELVDEAQWYLEFVPSSGHYRFKNAATGNYLTHTASASAMSLKGTKTPGAVQNFQLMPGRNKVSYKVGETSFTDYDYWFSWTESSTNKSMGFNAFSEVLGYGSTKIEDFNYSDKGGTKQRYIIIPADQVKEALPATPDAIGSVNIDDDHVGNAEIYGISGIRQNTMQKGMNIIRTANGKVKKVYVK